VLNMDSPSCSSTGLKKVPPGELPKALLNANMLLVISSLFSATPFENVLVRVFCYYMVSSGNSP
jgi:hypothetical protein